MSKENNAETWEKIEGAIDKSVNDVVKSKMEGVIKAADLEKNSEETIAKMKSIMDEASDNLKSEVREDVMEIISKANKANDVQKAEDRWEETQNGELYKYRGDLNDIYKAVRDAEIAKAITTNVSTTGSPEVVGQIFTPLDGMNAWRQDVNVQSYENVNTDTFVVLRVDQLAFGTARANSAAAFGNAQNGDQGSSSEEKHQFINHELKATISKVAADDVPAYLGMLEVAAGMADMKNKGAIINARLKADMVSDTAGSLAKVTTGAANAHPTKANWVKKLGEMTSQIAGDYRSGCTWHFSPEAYGAAVAAADGEFAFSVSEGITRLLGYPVRINDRLDAGTGSGSNGQISVMFGNWRRTNTLAERTGLDISWNPYFSLGNYTLYVSSRFESVIVERGNDDRRTAVGLITGS